MYMQLKKNIKLSMLTVQCYENEDFLKTGIIKATSVQLDYIVL